MKVLFCHDGPLGKDEKNIYYGISYSDDTFKRYYNIADKLTIAIRVNRVKNEEEKKRLSKISITPIEVIECPNLSSLKGMLLYRRLTNEMIKEAVLKSDYIVARLPSFIGSISINYAKKYNKPYLVELVGCPWDALWNHSLKGKIIAPYMYYRTRRLVRNASHVIYVTSEFLQKRYPTYGKSIDCSDVVLPELNDEVLVKRLEKISSKQKNSKIILGTTAAVNVKYKGQENIIQALATLKNSGITHFEYHLVGDGDQSYLKSIANKFGVSDQVVFWGSVPHKSVLEWLDNIDIYLQPSKTEGLPRALIEAMSRGLPAAGANAGGIPELLDRKYIFSNSKNNINEICEILLSFDNTLMAEQAIRNYNVSRKFGIKSLESRRIEFYNEFRLRRTD